METAITAFNVTTRVSEWKFLGLWVGVPPLPTFNVTTRVSEWKCLGEFSTKTNLGSLQCDHSRERVEIRLGRVYNRGAARPSM